MGEKVSKPDTTALSKQVGQVLLGATVGGDLDETLNKSAAKAESSLHNAPATREADDVRHALLVADEAGAERAIAEDAEKQLADVEKAPLCTRCGNKLELTNRQDGDYHGGWRCDTVGCGAQWFPAETMRWICVKCNLDFCTKCFPCDEEK